MVCALSGLLDWTGREGVRVMGALRPLKAEKALPAEALRDAIGRVLAVSPDLIVFVKNVRTGMMFNITAITEAQVGTAQAIVISIGR